MTSPSELRGTARVERPTLPLTGGGGEQAGHWINWHLILAWLPDWQSPEDWEEIAYHVRTIEPRIATFVVRGDQAHSYTRRRAAGRPSFIFSPGQLPTFRPLRGRLYQGNPIAKFEQLKRLAAAGVPVPMTTILTPELRLDPSVWGDFVIVKPGDNRISSFGQGVQLMRTGRVRYVPPAELPAGHPGRFGPMLVQRFIDTGDRISHYRALTLFGEPLYVQFGRSVAPRVSLDASDEEIESAVVVTQNIDKDKRLTKEADVIAMARAAHAAMPEIPLKGCDILREEATGALYVLEVNPGGNTWHFSSASSATRPNRNPPEFEEARRKQFDALRTAARILAERTMAEAV